MDYSAELSKATQELNQSRSKGMDFARFAIAKALSENSESGAARNLAITRWGRSSAVADLITKTSVGAGSTSSLSQIAGTSNVIAEFLELVRPLTILGRLKGIRNVPTNMPFVALSTGATSYWVGAGKGTPVSSVAFSRSQLPALKAACLVVFSKEILESSDPKAEDLIRLDLARSTAELIDRTFLSPSNAGVSGQAPASITYGVSAVSATSNFSNDVAAAVAAFTGNIETSTFIMTPKLSAKLGLRSGGIGVGSDLGAVGGMLGGIPVLVSSAAPTDAIILLDAASVCMVDAGAELSVSKQGSIEMSTAPTGDINVPTAASVNFVNLFQTESIALIVTRFVNWQLARSGAVAIITNASYTAA